ncbi:MAG: DUF1266 domain-containing protein [Corynebacterium sp.]|uniref:DUF1266 domain-containing protein n=1 Tax=Corynebacterium sp. TaxID=1720 RepID=UPI0026DACF10|nr:DUF1266 domain-containing protein [Corynebacterium sp.]MDO5099480.1 DUF1266 domain-containing protein [Corynebacterium sp.]
MHATVTVLPFTTNKSSSFKWSSKNPDPDMVRAGSYAYMYRDVFPIRPAVDAPAKKQGGLIRGELANGLKEMWNVENEEQVRTTCENLLSNAFGYPMFDAIIAPSERLLSVKQNAANPLDFHRMVDEYTMFLRGLMYYNHYDPDQAAKAFQIWIERFIHPEFQKIAPKEIPSTLRAWDLLRVEAVAGNGVRAGLIAPELGAEYAHRAVRELQRTFATWHQVALSYWWGRAMWLSDEPFDAEQHLIHNDCLTRLLVAPDSPWVRVPLRP